MGYRALIIESTGCSPLAAAEVEEVMRETYHTLDGLNRKTFVAAAKRAYKIVLAEKKR